MEEDKQKRYCQEDEKAEVAVELHDWQWRLVERCLTFNTETDLGAAMCFPVIYALFFSAM